MPWVLAYKHGTISSGDLEEMSDEFLEYVREAGGFALARTSVAPSKALPSREKQTVSAYVLDPISLGQGWWNGETSPYTENAILLRTASAQFQRKKARIGIGIGCIVLTQHLLERVYERTEIQREELGPLIESEFHDLIRALTLADTASLWIQRIEEDGVCRITAVPYSNGLMITDQRFLFSGAMEDGELGFYVDLRNGEMQTPFVNPSKILSDLPEGRYFNGGARPIIILCGVTYLNALTLDRDESDYLFGFRALMDEIGAETLDALAHLTLSPLPVHEKNPSYLVADRFLPRTAKLAALLNSGWLKAKLTQPMCFLLPYDHQIPRR
jgi:hypothetical protein